MNDQMMEHAARFIEEELAQDPDVDRYYLVQKAEKRFDLSLIQEEKLIKKYLDPEKEYVD
ncbi:MAG: hypothetical protein ACRCUT_02635 [Spirochaetota bacterium]